MSAISLAGGLLGLVIGVGYGMPLHLTYSLFCVLALGAGILSGWQVGRSMMLFVMGMLGVYRAWFLARSIYYIGYIRTVTEHGPGSRYVIPFKTVRFPDSVKLADREREAVDIAILYQYLIYGHPRIVDFGVLLLLAVIVLYLGTTGALSSLKRRGTLDA